MKTKVRNVVMFAGVEDELCLGAVRANCSLWAGKPGAKGGPRARSERQPPAGVRVRPTDGKWGQVQLRVGRQSRGEEGWEKACPGCGTAGGPGSARPVVGQGRAMGSWRLAPLR